MKITNNFKLPKVVVDALTFDEYSRGASNRSVTQLIDSPRISILQRENEEEIEQDAVDFLWSRFGTSVHGMFEKSLEDNEDQNILSEERLFAEVDGWTISGAIDLQEVTSRGVIISDYKVTSVWSVIYDKQEWHNQLNVYAWLVRQSKQLKVKQLRIIAILRDWQRRKAEEEGDYPQSPIHIVEIPVWNPEECDEYVRGRVSLHQEAEYQRITDNDLVKCSDKERWKKDDTYAVMKSGRKRALRVLKTKEDAADYLESSSERGLMIEVRTGEDTRCVQNWCRVRDWCDQFQAGV